jgi:putative transposase
MCQWLKISRSGFYRWLAVKPSQRQLQERILAQRVTDIFEQSHQSYGSPRITVQLAQQGWTVSRKRVIRLMQQQGLVARHRPKRSRQTSAPETPAAPNHLNRQFTVDHPDQVWVGDITYLPSTEGWRYLAVWIDLFSRRVVGWALADHLQTELVLEALQRAFGHRLPHPTGLLVHSDQGCQYTSHAYHQVLSAWGLTCSMSRRGNCWDNAVAESFFSTLKTELLSKMEVLQSAQLQVEVATWIEGFYNQHRKHSTLNYLSPIEFEQRYHDASRLISSVA